MDQPAPRPLTAAPPRAAGFIVTLYGDAIVPRGGEVWIGTLIDTCALVGISETLVRTAVSRLVSGGQLQGGRQGRRSFYRLTDAARAEFQAAAAVIYGPPDATGWRLVHLPEDDGIARLERQGFARLRPGLALGPARGAPPPGAVVIDGGVTAGAGALPDLAASLWDLSPHAAAYAAFLDRFGALDPGLQGAEALAARLVMVHDWRRALLRDPRLPAGALPPDWPGHAARALFHRLYSALAPAAEAHIDATFQGAAGPIPPRAEILQM